MCFHRVSVDQTRNWRANARGSFFVRVRPRLTPATQLLRDVGIEPVGYGSEVDIVF